VVGTTTKLPPQVADSVALAFAHTFWWSVGAIMIAFIPTLFLPNHAATQQVPPDEDAGTSVSGDAGDIGGGGGDEGEPGPRVAGAMLD
ncbi:MAG TPA: hypothetical protein VHD39_06550, partial [Acidimicrobiales bacterium]|nr:hypothetical protein [Acidimicrobiales bacterium]